MCAAKKLISHPYRAKNQESGPPHGGALERARRPAKPARGPHPPRGFLLALDTSRRRGRTVRAKTHLLLQRGKGPKPAPPDAPSHSQPLPHQAAPGQGPSARPCRRSGVPGGRTTARQTRQANCRLRLGERVVAANYSSTYKDEKTPELAPPHEGSDVRANKSHLPLERGKPAKPAPPKHRRGAPWAPPRSPTVKPLTALSRPPRPVVHGPLQTDKSQRPPSDPRASPPDSD